MRRTQVVLGVPTELLDKLTRLEALLRNTDTNGCTRHRCDHRRRGQGVPPYLSEHMTAAAGLVLVSHRAPSRI